MTFAPGASIGLDGSWNRREDVAVDRKPMVRLLGPIDVLRPDGAVEIGGHARRALLGVLAIHAGRAVPVDELKLVLWDDRPPSSAANVLQSYVSNLRHILGDEAVLRTDHSYALACDQVTIDAVVFETLVSRAHDADEPTERLRLCREALALWRGRAFGELGDEAPFDLESYRLDALRQAVMELSLDAELRVGRHELVVGELESAVREHPYNERLWFLLIAALALSERRVEALRACAEIRRKLRDVGVGVEERILCLERLILDGSELTVEQAIDPCASDESRTPNAN
jgi:DNA-binding SARP family transcriptional activator